MQENQDSLTKVLYAGSFDPLHIGHRSIVERALLIFDKVIVCVAINPDKNYAFSVEERIEIIKKEFNNNPNVEVVSTDGWVIDVCHAKGIHHIIKGVRNVEDFVYEKEQAEWNKSHGNIETILLFAEPGMENVNSTLIRQELEKKQLI